MICLEDKVKRIGENSPTGIVKKINTDGTATVLWGISDGVSFTEDILLDNLNNGFD